MGVLQQKTIYKPAMNSDVNVFIDGRGYQKSAMVMIVRRQISPAAAERDSQWRTRDDHFRNANMERPERLVQRSRSPVNFVTVCPGTDSISPGFPPARSCLLRRATRRSIMKCAPPRREPVRKANSAIEMQFCHAAGRSEKRRLEMEKGLQCTVGTI